MKTRNFISKMNLIIATVTMMVLLTSQFAVSQDWYNTSWQYRRLVNVPNPGATTLTDYQVKINLISPAFDFNNAKADGSDIRLTASDGVTLIPYWIEEWDFDTQATIWVRVPSISTTGTTVYLYYNNPAANSISDANTVFDFYDGFDGTALNTNKWTVANGNISQASVSGGLLTLTATSAFIRILATSSFGMNYMGETYARHPNQGIQDKIAEYGFADEAWNTVRIVDDFKLGTTYWQKQSKIAGPTDIFLNMAQTADQNWHIFHTYRQSPNIAGFQIDNHPVETVTTGSGDQSVPTGNLPPFLMSFGDGNQIIVDWTRVRKWVGSDPATTVGPEKTNCPDTPVASATAQPTCTVATGTITVTSPTGTGITYSINEGPYQSSPVFSGLIPGIYYVKAKNSVPCISPPSSAITINPQPLTPDQPTASVTQPICAVPTGTITVTSPIGSGMTYSIGGPYQSSLEFSGLNPGLYYLTAKNSDGCISPTASVTVDAVTGAPEAPTATVTQPDCNLSTGEITITAPLAEGMEYSKDGINYSTNKIFSGLIPGSYNLTAKNAAGCISPITNVIINSPPSNNLDSWYNADWPYRRAFSVTNPGGTALTDYQLLITLSNSFEFSKTKTDGSDIRFTSNDGKTALPYWIETWNPSGQQATIWVKVPSIPIAGTSIFLYYGNPTPTIDLPIPVEVPPTGPFTRAVGNPIIPSGAGNNTSLLAENIVYDPVTNHYWMCLANYSQAAISLCYSDNPTNPGAWVWSGNVITSFTSFYSGAPHLLKNGSTWYLFYADRPNIRVATATNVAGPYTINPTPVLSPSSPSSAWDSFRVDEPYVFYRASDSKWILIYMGDAGGVTEQVGYATADNITGPYTAYAGNPCIPFGPAGSYDAGTVADPWVYEFQGVYYIGYTVSSTKNSPWQTALATTTDWNSFTKHGVILPASGTPLDTQNSFRGAVTRIGDTYVFSYTCGGFQMGIATQPVYVTPASIFNNAAAVFDFYDGFDGNQLDGTKWSISKLFGQTGSASVNNGFLTLRANSNPSSDLILMTGNSSFGPGNLLEVYARHSDANGSGTNASELGFGNASRTNILRILDYNSSKFIKNNTANNNGENDYSNLMAYNLDNINFLLHKIYWKSSSEVDYAIGTDAYEPLTTNIPSVTLPPWLMCAALPNQATLLVDWIRVRKMALVEPTTTIELEQNQTPPAQPVAVVSSQPTCTVATGTITVTSSVVGLHFSIDGSDYTNSTGIFTLVLPGNYTVTSKNSDGCISAPSATVIINPQPETPNQPSAEVTPLTCAIPFGTINVTSSTEGLSFSIDGSNYTNTNGIFTGLNPGTYNLTAKNSSGCVSTAVILII